MEKIIGIRREDKNPWEKRVPLVPADIHDLVAKHSITTVLQPSKNHRIFTDEQYEQAGAVINEDLSDCPIILGVKEIPTNLIQSNTVYVYFSHVIKGQSYNMPMLRSILDKNCSLIDYEKIEDNEGIRLIFFGRYAGVAGMVESLRALGMRLEADGISSPFSKIKQPHEYASLDDIKKTVALIGEDIKANGLPAELPPFICGFTGYGHVSKGAQEIFDLMPVQEIDPEDIRGGIHHLPKNALYKTVFYEKNMFEPLNENISFDLNHYFNHPEQYRNRFDDFVPNLSMIINCIYWTESCPKLVTKKQIKELYSRETPPRLKVIGDISCDIEGSIEITLDSTTVGDPIYAYEPFNNKMMSLEDSDGPVIMAIENLPCEIARESSIDFSNTLSKFIPSLIEFSLDPTSEKVKLPSALQRALIVRNGELMPNYRYIKDFLTN